MTAPAQAFLAVLAHEIATTRTLPLSFTAPTFARFRGGVAITTGGGGGVGATTGVIGAPLPPSSPLGLAGQSSRRSRSVTGGGMVSTPVAAASLEGSAADTQPSLDAVTT